jgi:hypothetical protein
MWNICTKPDNPTILISVEDPVPEGYTVEAQTANPNYLTDIVAALGGRRLTKLAFRNRFTTAEKIALEMAQLDDPAGTPQQRQISATLRVILKDLDNSVYIDLDRVETIQGINFLVSIGIISSERGTQILTNPVQNIERPI